MDKDSKSPVASIRIGKRWAEANRPKKQIKLRLDPNIIDEIEAKAAASGLNRTEWIETALKLALKT